VRDEKHRKSVFALQLREQGKNLRLHRDVERGCRLIGDQEARTIDESHGDENALAPAASDGFGCPGIYVETQDFEQRGMLKS
jgi:hypothetical protein